MKDQSQEETEVDEDEDAETEEVKPWRDMMRGRRPRQLSLTQEQDLIAQYQKGNKNAANKLLIDYDLFVRNLAHKVARLTGAYKVEEDMAQVARITLYEKMTTYELTSKARLSSYAFRKILQCMNKVACENLESIRLPRDAVTYAAHRDFEQGMSAEEVHDKHGLSLEAIMSLQRVTLPTDAIENIDLALNVNADDAVAQRELNKALTTAWSKLSVTQRALLGLRISGETEGERAKMVGLSRYDLAVYERIAIQRLMELLGEYSEAMDLG